VVVIATQGHGDEDALETAIAISPAYLGVVASGKRGEALRGYLADRGIDPAVIDRIRVPVGLDLGHTSHREVAVAVLAELVQRRAAGEFPAAGAVATRTVDEVIDPVCGMTVAADPANYPVDHDGTTYYFCCPGCRYSFKKDPASFLSQEVSC
jgi:xanthine dehydrogenase accessory factor